MFILDLLELKGSIVAMGTINTQKKIVDNMHRKSGDYLLFAKENHPHLHGEISDYFNKLYQETKLESEKNITTEIKAKYDCIDIRHYRQCLVSD